METSVSEILKKVRLLEIKSKKLARDIFTGEYHTAFRGTGMSFKEVREYAPGDDVRFIDWNVSARFGHPYSKIFEEERGLTVMLLIDISNSSLFGTRQATKMERATEIAALLGFSAINNGDKVGAIFFTDIIEGFYPPKKGKEQALLLVRHMLTKEPRSKGTSITQALKYLNNISGKKCIVFVISDFLDSAPTVFADALKIAARRHDIIGIKLYDQMDIELPDVGILQVEDAESGQKQWIDTGNARVQQEHERSFFLHTEQVTGFFKKAGADLLHCRTDEDYVKILQRFFLSRK